MRIWIDLANSPHVPFFRSLADEFLERNHELLVTARACAETVELAQAAGFSAEVIGGHGGGKLSGKAGNLVQRGLALARWARGRGIDLAVSHNSYSQILAARALTLRTETLMDYEHQPANHLAFRFASRIIVPRAFPDEALNRYGAQPAKVFRYAGIKEDVYLADFKPDPQFQQVVEKLGIDSTDILVIVRPPAGDALYHRFENQLFDKLIEQLLAQDAVTVLLLPRNDAQKQTYVARSNSKLIVPQRPLDGANLIAFSDLVVSAGGTMNREAAALGVPAASIYLGEWAAIDEQLVNEGRLQKLSNLDDVQKLRPVKKATGKANRRESPGVNARRQVAGLILDW
jgi:predicted glycosyltransferase